MVQDISDMVGSEQNIPNDPVCLQDNNFEVEGSSQRTGIARQEGISSRVVTYGGRERDEVARRTHDKHGACLALPSP